ncbi:hypothetical protein [Pseudoalteromonas sp. RW-H-Ap-1]|uniref:hypothetical protein n=1 Tax=Pseudoalteromonas sp. RW-H-Ap-1 TaxID=3241171 RepID=UPI00390C73F4
MKLEQLLVEQFDITDADLTRALNYQKKYGGRLEQILVNMGSLPDDQVQPLIAKYLMLPVFNILEWQEVDLPLLDAAEIHFLINNNWLLLKKTLLNGFLLPLTHLILALTTGL